LPLAPGCSQKHGDGDSQDPYVWLLGKLAPKRTKSEMIKRRSVKKRVKLVGLRTRAHMMMMKMEMLSEKIQRVFRLC
jgi:hypothetical protein